MCYELTKTTLIITLLVLCDTSYFEYFVMNDILNENLDCDILENDLFWDVYMNNYNISKEVIIIKMLTKNSSDRNHFISDRIVSHIMKQNLHPSEIRKTFDHKRKKEKVKYVDTYYWDGTRIDVDENLIEYDDLPIINIVKNILIIVENDIILKGYTEGVRRFPFYSPLSQFIIVIMSNADENWHETIRTVLINLWHHYAIKNVLIYTCFLKNNLFYWNSPFEYTDTGFGHIFINTTIARNHIIDYPQDKNYKGYTLKISVFDRYPTATITQLKYNGAQAINLTQLDISGVDADVFENLLYDLNLTADILNIEQADKTGYGFKDDETEIFVGSAGDILYHRAEININARFMKFYDSYELAFTYPAFTDMICVVVPKSLIIPEWQMLFHCFRGLVWASFVLLSIFCGCFWYCIQRCYRKYLGRSKYGENIEQLQLNMCLLMTSYPIPNTGRTGAEKMFIAGCLMFNVIIVGTFQVSLKLHSIDV